MQKRWKYNGDMNLEHGGFFYQESGFADHVYCVDVIPASDMGGPDNVFIIEKGSIYIADDKEKQARALDCIGKKPEEASRFDLIYAMKAYAGIERDLSETIRIGKADPYGPEWHGEIDSEYRGNRKIENIIREQWL